MATKTFYFKAKKTIIKGMDVLSYSKAETEISNNISQEDLDEMRDFIQCSIAKELNVFPDSVKEITAEEYEKEKED